MNATILAVGQTSGLPVRGASGSVPVAAQDAGPEARQPADRRSAPRLDLNGHD
jgi:hypothetical protein